MRRDPVLGQRAHTLHGKQTQHTNTSWLVLVQSPLFSFFVLLKDSFPDRNSIPILLVYLVYFLHFCLFCLSFSPPRLIPFSANTTYQYYFSQYALHFPVSGRKVGTKRKEISKSYRGRKREMGRKKSDFFVIILGAFQKTSRNNSNTVVMIQRRGRLLTDYKNHQKVCLVHYN